MVTSSVAFSMVIPILRELGRAEPAKGLTVESLADPDQRLGPLREALAQPPDRLRLVAQRDGAGLLAQAEPDAVDGHRARADEEIGAGADRTAQRVLGCRLLGDAPPQRAEPAVQGLALHRPDVVSQPLGRLPRGGEGSGKGDDLLHRRGRYGGCGHEVFLPTVGRAIIAARPGRLRLAVTPGGEYRRARGGPRASARTARRRMVSARRAVMLMPPATRSTVSPLPVEQPRGIGDGDAAGRREAADQGDEKLISMHHRAYICMKTHGGIKHFSAWRVVLYCAHVDGDSTERANPPCRERGSGGGGRGRRVASRRRTGSGPGRCAEFWTRHGGRRPRLIVRRRSAPRSGLRFRSARPLTRARPARPVRPTPRTPTDATDATGAGGAGGAAGVWPLREPPAPGLPGGVPAFPPLPLRGLERAVRDLVRLVAEAGGDPIPGELRPAAAVRFGGADARPVAAANEDGVPPGARSVGTREVEAAAGGGAVNLDEAPVKGPVWFRRDWLDGHGIDPTRCVVISVRGGIDGADTARRRQDPGGSRPHPPPCRAHFRRQHR